MENGGYMVVKNSMKNKNYAAAIERGIVKGLEIMGKNIAGQASLDAPRDEGHLAGSIDYATNKKSGKNVSQPKDRYTVHVGTNVEYAAIHEFGHGPYWIGSPVKIKGVGWRYIGEHPGITAQPYLRPALDRNRDAKPIKRAIADEMKKENRRG